MGSAYACTATLRLLSASSHLCHLPVLLYLHLDSFLSTSSLHTWGPSLTFTVPHAFSPFTTTSGLCHQPPPQSYSPPASLGPYTCISGLSCILSVLCHSTHHFIHLDCLHLHATYLHCAQVYISPSPPFPYVCWPLPAFSPQDLGPAWDSAPQGP